MSALRIFMIEDNAMNMMLARDLLEVSGHEVMTASRPDEALAAAPTPVPDLVLMDIMLPDMDGVTLMKVLRQRVGWESVPFVAFTAHAMAGDRERLLSEGFVGYLSKPIETRRFVSDVEQWARRSRSSGSTSVA